jgi:hypothetical protein
MAADIEPQITTAVPSPAVAYRIAGTDVRLGSDFRLTCKPSSASSATFVAVHDGVIRVTRRLTDIIHLPDETPVVAHWHGQYRTDGFAMTIADLKGLAIAWDHSNTRAA